MYRRESPSVSRGYSASPETDHSSQNHRGGGTNDRKSFQGGHTIMAGYQSVPHHFQASTTSNSKTSVSGDTRYQYYYANGQSNQDTTNLQPIIKQQPVASALKYGPPYTSEFVNYSHQLASGGGGGGDRGTEASRPLAGFEDHLSARAPQVQFDLTTPSRNSENNVYSRPSSQHNSVAVGGNTPLDHNPQNPFHSPSDAQLRAAEQAKVRWAFSVDRTSRVHQPLITALTSSNIREDLVGVVRLLSSATSEVQTTNEPSYISSMAGVNAARKGKRSADGSLVADDDDDEDLKEGRGGALQTENLRSIGVQSGLGLNRSNTATQVVEGDIASTAPTAQLDYDKIVALQQQQEDEQDDASYYAGGHKVALNPSAYVPFSPLPTEEYPIYLAEARRLGVANRYGFVSLPRPPIELPPRRKVRAVQPVQYPHLHGRHELALDEVCTSQLTRAYSLWIQGTGFVPKY